MLKNKLMMIMMPTSKCQSEETSSYCPIRRKSNAVDLLLKSILKSTMTRARSVISRILCLMM